MKKTAKPSDEDMPAEYDFGKMGPGVRGQYAGRLKDKVLVALDSDLAAELRSVLRARANSVSRAASVPRRAAGSLRSRKK
jgi:hypothetical protein